MPTAHEREMIVEYSANITAGALRLAESRLVAELLLGGADKTDWSAAVAKDNILQSRRRTTASRVVRLLRQRLEPMGSELWSLVATGDAEAATQAVLASAINHSRLLGDFMLSVVRDRWRTTEPRLTVSDWESFLQDCRGRAPSVSRWSHVTCQKCRATIFLILAESAYIESTARPVLQSVHIAPELLRLLEATHMRYVLRCMQATT